MSFYISPGSDRIFLLPSLSEFTVYDEFLRPSTLLPRQFFISLLMDILIQTLCWMLSVVLPWK